MADDSLKDPISLASVNIMAQSLPAGFSQAYRSYVLSQSADLTKVVGKANDAGSGAWDAQVKNDQQDVELEDHEQRITANESTLANHEIRIAATETTLSAHEARITANTAAISAQGGRLASVEGSISTLQTSVGAIREDYVSKSATSSQTISGPLSVTASLSVNGTQVIGPRQTGWTPATGTANKGSFNASQAFTVSSTYTQSEMLEMAEGLVVARKRIKALEDALRDHGLIA